MSKAGLHRVGSTSGTRILTAVAASLVFAALAATPVAAQDDKKAAAPAPAAKEAAPPPAKDKAGPPAAAAPAAKDAPAKDAAPGKDAAAGKEKPSAWVKLCEKANFTTKDKDGKETKNDKEICLTHHERLDASTGMVIVSAAIRQLEGNDKPSLMIMVPLGMAIPPGVRAAVYSKEQWAQAAKNEKIDEKALKPVELKFSLCHTAGCTAETDATPELIEQMKTGGGLMVLAINPALKPIGFPVPLEGFADAYSGKPIDNKKYAEARGELMKQIRKHQADLAEKQKQDMAEKKKARDELLKTPAPNAKAEGDKAGPPPAKAADAKAPAPATEKK